MQKCVCVCVLTEVYDVRFKTERTDKINIGLCVNA